MGYTTLKAALDAVVKSNGRQQITGSNLNGVLTTILQGVDVLDRANPADTSGLDYVVLKKNRTFAEQVTAQNTIYEIRDNFTLSNASVTIPSGCILKFNGGLLSNGTLNGQNTGIVYEGAIFTNIAISGTWIVPEIRSSMFTDISNNGLKHLFALQNANIHNDLIVEDGNYVVGFSNQEGGAYALQIRNNTDCIINGTISLDTNQRSQDMLTYGYRMIQLVGMSSLTGNGMLIGDITINKENTEAGHGIYVQDGSMVEISGLTIKDFAGDCIAVGPRNVSVYVHDVEISNWNRNGVSVVDCENYKMENIYAHDGGFTSPYAIIDLEPNANMSVLKASIKNVTAENVGVGFSCTNEHGVLGDVSIENVDVSGCVQDAIVVAGANGMRSITIKNAKIHNFPADHAYSAGNIIRMWIYDNAYFENMTLDVSDITTKTEYGCIIAGTKTLFESCTFIGGKFFSNQFKNAILHNCFLNGDLPLWPSAGDTYKNILFDACHFETGNVEFRNRCTKILNCTFDITAFNNTNYGVVRIYNEGSPADFTMFCNNTIVVTSNQTPATKDFVVVASGKMVICTDNLINNKNGGANGGIYANSEQSLFDGNIFLNFSASQRKIVAQNGKALINVGLIPKAGTTANRPTLQSDYYFGGSVGTTYFDTDLGKMIVWNGSAWVNVDGSALS